MQLKVLYSFNNNPTVFLSRSKNQYSVKIVQIPMQLSSNPLQSQESEYITLGAFDLKTCTQQILKSSPENFHLNIEDYAVYYKDITEQPDEPFVANGIMSGLLNSSKNHLIPGRVCQNLSASYLFGDKSNSSSLTLEIRLKFHTIEKETPPSNKRPSDSLVYAKRQKSDLVVQNQPINPVKASSPNLSNPDKATRTKSLPIFYHPHSQQVFNIINADKLSAPSKYDSKSVQDRFKLAPFLLAKIIDNPASKKIRKTRSNPVSNHQPPSLSVSNQTSTPVDGLLQRAVRTRSMISHNIISSPINEVMSDETDDTEYNDNNQLMRERDIDDEVDEDDEDDDDYKENPQSSPYNQGNTPVISSANNKFHSLPALEDLDSKKTHTIPDTKLPKDHGLVCTNSNCATTSSITWRYFETKFHPSYLTIHRAKEFNKKNYEGMFGPLCNACYLFLRNKGFMRPEGVVKKYLQQQKYKRETKKELPMKKITNSSSPVNIQSTGRFLTPSHTPSAINQVIQNNHNNNSHSNTINGNNRNTMNDLNDFMNQLNSFGGPLTDIDPLPQDPMQQGITPPMIATKSNTRVINLYEDDNENIDLNDASDDKENWPPSDENDFDKMILKSFKDDTPNNSNWSSLFGEQTPRDNNSTTPKFPDNLPQMRTFKSSSSPVRIEAKNITMPSSPLLNANIAQLDDEVNNLVNTDIFSNQSSSPEINATRLDTVMSFNPNTAKQSSPTSEFFSNDDAKN